MSTRTMLDDSMKNLQRQTDEMLKLRKSHAALLGAAKAALAVLNGMKSYKNTQEQLRQAIKETENV